MEKEACDVQEVKQIAQTEAVLNRVSSVETMLEAVVDRVLGGLPQTANKVAGGGNGGISVKPPVLQSLRDATNEADACINRIRHLVARLDEKL